MAKKTSPPARRDGPYLQYAVVCERLLEEQDNVRSLIRIVDVFRLSSDKDEMPPGVVTPTVAVAFKSGGAVGEFKLELKATDPSGKRLARMVGKIELKGHGHGALLAHEFPIPITKPGLYWIDVKLNSRTMTRMPLDIHYTKVQPSPDIAAATDALKRRVERQSVPGKRKKPRQ
jgi:hypothetical protein